MAYRLMSRSKSLTTQPMSRHGLRSLLIAQSNNPSASFISPSATQLLSSPSSLLPSPFYKNLHDMRSTVATKEEGNYTKSMTDGSHKILASSPLESTATKELKRALDVESLKTKRMALSKKITFALIPALLLVSKSNLLTSILVLAVYWQIYCFWKEIFVDYIHHEVTRTWVLNYFAALLIILAKDTLFCFDLV